MRIFDTQNNLAESYEDGDMEGCGKSRLETCTIHNVPAEILCYIFRLLIQNFIHEHWTGETKNKRPKAGPLYPPILGICKRFREYALGDRSLWATILFYVEFPLSGPRGHFYRPLKMLERSFPAPVQLYVNRGYAQAFKSSCMGRRTPHEVLLDANAAALEHLSQNPERVGSLIIDCMFGEPIAKLFALGLPSLRALCLSNLELYPLTNDIPPDLIDINNMTKEVFETFMSGFKLAKNLRKLTMVSCSLKQSHRAFFSLSHNITDLRICNGGSSGAFLLSDIVSMLRQIPRLEVLVLHDAFHISESDYDFPMPIPDTDKLDFPNLSTLRLTSTNPAIRPLFLLHRLFFSGPASLSTPRTRLNTLIWTEPLEMRTTPAVYQPYVFPPAHLLLTIRHIVIRVLPSPYGSRTRSHPTFYQLDARSDVVLIERWVERPDSAVMPGLFEIFDVIPIPDGDYAGLRLTITDDDDDDEFFRRLFAPRPSSESSSIYTKNISRIERIDCRLRTSEHAEGMRCLLDRIRVGTLDKYVPNIKEVVFWIALDEEATYTGIDAALSGIFEPTQIAAFLNVMSDSGKRYVERSMGGQFVVRLALGEVDGWKDRDRQRCEERYEDVLLKPHPPRYH